MMSRNDVIFGTAFAVPLLINMFSPQLRLWLFIILFTLAGAFVINVSRNIVASLIRVGIKIYEWFRFSFGIYGLLEEKAKNGWQRLHQQLTNFLDWAVSHLEGSSFYFKETLALIPDIFEHAQSVLPSLLQRGQDFFQSVAGLLKQGFQYLAGWVHLFVRIVLHKHPREGDQQMRVVFIVSIPSGKSYEEMKKRIKKTPPQCPPINWDSGDSSQIPCSTKLTTSVRHFAICVINLTTWTDPDKPLWRKFVESPFWDLDGPNLHPLEGDCDLWNEDKIKSIDSIYEVGLITYRNSAISDEMYKPLRDAWDSYEIIGWSSWDFAIRLACLILNDDVTKSGLRDLREKIETIRSAEVLQYDILEKWGSTIFNCFFYWGSIHGIPIIIIAVAATTFQVLNPWASLVHFGISFLLSWLGYTEPRFMGLWRRRAELIEKRFPQLVGLINWPQSGRH